MDRKKEIKEELEELSPFLANLKKEESFQVPDNYFNQLEADIWKQVQPPPVAEPVRSSETSGNYWLRQLEQALTSLFQPRLALSLASMLLLLTAGWFFLQDGKSDVELMAQDAPSLEEASDYLASHLDEFDAELLMQLELDEQDLSLFSEGSLGEAEELDDVFDELLDELDTDELESLL